MRTIIRNFQIRRHVNNMINNLWREYDAPSIIEVDVVNIGNTNFTLRIKVGNNITIETINFWI